MVEGRKPVNQTYIAISSCCIFLFVFIFYLAYVMLPTYQVQLGFKASYSLTEAQQNIAHDSAMLWLTHLPRWVGTLVIFIVFVIIIGIIKAFTDLFHFEGIFGFIISIICVAIVIAIGLIFLGQLHQEAGVQGVATYAASSAIVSQLGTIPNWIGILVTVALVFIILGYFYNRDAF